MIIIKNKLCYAKKERIKEDKNMATKIYSIEDIKNKVYEILANTEIEEVILFGSQAKNNATKNSDTDVSF